MISVSVIVVGSGRLIKYKLKLELVQSEYH